MVPGGQICVFLDIPKVSQMITIIIMGDQIGVCVCVFAHISTVPGDQDSVCTIFPVPHAIKFIFPIL